MYDGYNYESQLKEFDIIVYTLMCGYNVLNQRRNLLSSKPIYSVAYNSRMQILISTYNHKHTVSFSSAKLALLIKDDATTHSSSHKQDNTSLTLWGCAEMSS